MLRLVWSSCVLWRQAVFTVKSFNMQNVSIVIPARNEAQNISELLDRIFACCAMLSPEVIVVDDASYDGMTHILKDIRTRHPGLRVLRHDHAGGQSAAVHTGVTAASCDLIATLDGDGQNPPEELPGLIAPLLEDRTGRIGLVAGQRVARKDSRSKLWASRFANWLRSALLKDGTRDTGCGLKAFRRDAFLQLPYFDHMHRYMPALFARDGWEIVHVDVSHRERRGGRSHYSNLQRGLVGIVDLIGVAWLLRRRKTAHPLPEQEG